MENIHNKVTKNRPIVEKKQEEIKIKDPREKDTKSILNEVKSIMAEGDQASTAKKHSQTRNVEVKREVKKVEEKKEKKEDEYKAKGPKALFDHTMAQIGVYRNSPKNYEELSEKVSVWCQAPKTSIIGRNIREARMSSDKRQLMYATLKCEKQRIQDKVDSNLKRMEIEFEENRMRQEKKVVSETRRLELLIQRRYDALARERAAKIAHTALLCITIGSRAGKMYKALLMER